MPEAAVFRQWMEIGSRQDTDADEPVLNNADGRKRLNGSQCFARLVNVVLERVDPLPLCIDMSSSRGDTMPDTPSIYQDRIRIRHHLKPGDMGEIIRLHGVLYASEYGFDHSFEPYVALPLAEFVKSGSERERIWIVEMDDRLAGSMAIVAAEAEIAQLRWLLLAPEVRGMGMGRRLVEEGVAFARQAGYAHIFLWTISFLDAATHIYREAGFTRTEQQQHRIWGVSLTEQRFDLQLAGP